MTTSQNGIDFIKKFEGCRLVAYKCPAGVWTIGYGHTSGVKQGQTITQDKAEEYLKSDLAKYEKAVNKLKYDFNQNQFDALVSFAYNCGVGNLITLTNNSQRSIETISKMIVCYNKAGGKVLKGLVRRREAEQKLFNTDTYENHNDDKSIYEVACEVIAGRWGNGAQRKKDLTTAGYDYSRVQAMVNNILSTNTYRS